MRLVLVHFLALLAAPVGGTIGALVLAKGTRRLIRWHSVSDDSSWMFSIREGPGSTWYIIAALVRAIAALGAARVVFALLAVSPTVYLAAAVVLMLFSWDVWRLRFATRASFPVPSEITSALRFRIGAGLVASSVAAVLFLHS